MSKYSPYGVEEPLHGGLHDEREAELDHEEEEYYGGGYNEEYNHRDGVGEHLGLESSRY